MAYPEMIISPVRTMNKTTEIISLSVNNFTFSESLQNVWDAGMAHQPGFICFANVHMVIEAHTDDSFRQDLQKARFIFSDGKPLALFCSWFRHTPQERVAGMDFMPAILQRADEQGARVFLYGSTPAVLEKLQAHIHSVYPRVELAGAISPPFRTLSPDETAEHIQQINDSNAHFVLVALGCPKQEKWMARHYTSINAALLGVGGAFPVMAGTQKRAPRWMQRFALEWFYRLLEEPRRMFPRYLYTNSYFTWLVLKDLVLRPFQSRKKKDGYQ